MKDSTKQNLLKFLKIFLPITLILYLYELTIGDYVSFGSLSVDYLFYYTTKSLFLFNFAGIALYLYLKKKDKNGKIFLLAMLIVSGFLFIIYFPLNVMWVINSPYDKYYFYEKDDIKYYIVSERFSALDGPNFRIYEEKSIFSFIKERIPADEQKLLKEGIDVSKARQDYIKKHFP